MGILAKKVKFVMRLFYTLFYILNWALFLLIYYVRNVKRNNHVRFLME